MKTKTVQAPSNATPEAPSPQSKESDLHGKMAGSEFPQQRFGYPIDPFLGGFAGGDLSDKVLMEFVCLSVFHHEQALRELIASGSLDPDRAVDLSEALEFSRMLVRAVFLSATRPSDASIAVYLQGFSGWHRWNDTSYFVLICASLYEAKDLIDERIVKKARDLKTVLDLVESLVIAEAGCFRGGIGGTDLEHVGCGAQTKLQRQAQAIKAQALGLQLSAVRKAA
jgi:hypothetical protein